jgi:hypothetical protein
MNVHLTLVSSNAKTGPIPVSTSSAVTCSDACPFKKDGCYADSGPLALHWSKVTSGQRGFVVNLSANSVSHADTLAKLGLPVAAVVPQDSPDRFTTPEGNRVVICPAQRVDGISCNTCRLCAKGNRGFIVGFKPHGTGAKRVQRITTAG